MIQQHGYKSEWKQLSLVSHTNIVMPIIWSGQSESHPWFKELGKGEFQKVHEKRSTIVEAEHSEIWRISILAKVYRLQDPLILNYVCVKL